jgi:hypothetical protein
LSLLGCEPILLPGGSPFAGGLRRHGGAGGELKTAFAKGSTRSSLEKVRIDFSLAEEFGVNVFMAAITRLKPSGAVLAAHREEV